ncbi:MAG: DAK2 domain-containing protein [Eubacterium sp.]|nr:DAK2 domain-containing protein [Eubacterium sp.]
MFVKDISADFVKEVFISGANNISNKKEYINELNVFPVPDGDTGTNMTLTIMSAVAEVKSLDKPTINSLAKAISGGSLRGARGNSGVILSQLLRGFCRDVKDKEEITLEVIASAFAHATETAYKAVMKPKEGTILTVARAMAEKASDLLSTEDDLVEYLEKIVEAGDEALAGTPELLPVLKEAGVVDSGGQGLMEIMRGFLMALKGEAAVLEGDAVPSSPARGAGLLEEIPTAKGSSRDDISTADIKFGYCTEFIVLLEKELSDKEIEKIKEFLLSIGDSLVCVADEEVLKIHVHTNHPGQAFEKGLEYGQLTRCKVDNMREEHNERISFAVPYEQNDKTEDTSEKTEEEKPQEPPKKYGFVAVSAGEGLSTIFEEIGVDYVIRGGQTMNPSTDDIISAIDKVNAENVFILPNNKNIVLAANQAAEIVDAKKVYVVTTATIPQGIAAMLEFNEALEPEENLEGMKEASLGIKTGEITFAVRDTSVEGKEIRKNNIMGISDNGIDAVGTDVEEVTKQLIDTLVDEDSGLISLYYGEDVSKEEAEAFAASLSEKYDDLDVDIRYGGQPIYYYILSVE